MPRRLRVATGGYAYHVLNRAVGRMRIFGKQRDFAALRSGLWGKAISYQLSVTEDREGGTMAIEDGVPGIEHEQLSVFTPAEWEKEKPTLMFDTWTERARAAKKK
jgi:hypothetical protein